MELYHSTYLSKENLPEIEILREAIKTLILSRFYSCIIESLGETFK